MSIGINIKKLRESKRISQEELALLMDVSQPVISSWESEKSNPNSKQIPKLADSLNVEIPELFKGIPNVKFVNNQNNRENSVNGFEVNLDARNMFEDYINSLKELNVIYKDEIKSLKDEIQSLKGKK